MKLSQPNDTAMFICFGICMYMHTVNPLFSNPTTLGTSHCGSDDVPIGLC